MAEGLKSASTVLREFRLILQSSFGPNGKDILLKSDTGVVYLTKDCDTILKHLEVKHPIGKIIKDTLQLMLDREGSGGKTFIVVLSHLTGLLMTKIVDQPNRSIEKVSFKLSNTAFSLLRIQNKLNESLQIGKIGNVVKSIGGNEFTDVYLEKLLMTNLEGKLQLSQAKVFLRLVKDVLVDIEFRENDVLTYIVHHFEDVCCPIIGPSLNESYVIEGCLIQRESKPTDFHVDKKAHFILIACESTDSNAKITLSLNTTNVNQLIHKSHNYHNIINLLKRNDVDVIFIEFQLPNKLVSLISKLDIVIVPYVLSSDLDRLSLQYNAPIFYGLYDLYNADLNESCTGCSSYVRSFNAGKIKGCLIGPTLSGKARHFVNKQILLCCPSPGLQIQYQKMSHDSFKMVSRALDKDTKCFDLVQAGGAFECHVAKQLNDYAKESANENERDLCHILVESLLSIPKLLHENAHQKCTKRFVLNVSLLGGKCVDIKNGNVIDLTEMHCYEAYQSKIDLLMNVLSVAVQFIKIQHIIPVTKAPTLPKDQEQLLDNE